MGKNVTQPKGLKVIGIQVENRSNNLEKRVVTLTFYVIKWKWQTYSACHKFLVVSKSYLDCILSVPKENWHSRFKLRRNDFVVQNVSRVFFMLSLLFCMWRRILRKSMKKCLLIFSEKCWCQHFYWDSRIIISKKGVATPIFLFGFQELLQRSPFCIWSHCGAKTSIFSRHRP